VTQPIGNAGAPAASLPTAMLPLGAAKPRNPEPPVARTSLPEATKTAVRRIGTSLEVLGTGGREAAKRLDDVLARIDQYSAAEVYATLDPIGAELSIEREGAHLLHILSLLRNALILLPLALTWGGLSWATAAYQSDLAAHPEDVNHPFLELWQNGFRSSGGLNSILSFSHLALVDVLLFGLLIGMGLWIDTATRGASARSRTARARLEEAAGSLSQYAGKSRPAATSPEAVNEWADKIQQLIQDATNYVFDASKSMENITRQIEGFQQSADSIALSAGKIGEQASALTGAVNSIRDGAKLMADAAGNLSTNTAEMRTAQNETTGAVRDLLGDVRAIARDTASANREVTGITRDFAQGLAQTRQAMSEAARRLETETAGASLDLVVNRLDGTAEALRQVEPRRGWWPFGRRRQTPSDAVRHASYASRSVAQWLRWVSRRCQHAPARHPDGCSIRDDVAGGVAVSGASSATTPRRSRSALPASLPALTRSCAGNGFSLPASRSTLMMPALTDREGVRYVSTRSGQPGR